MRPNDQYQIFTIYKKTNIKENDRNSVPCYLPFYPYHSPSCRPEPVLFENTETFLKKSFMLHRRRKKVIQVCKRPEAEYMINLDKHT